MGLEETSNGWSSTGVGTSAGVTVTKAASSDTTQKHMISGIAVSGDAAALVTIESPRLDGAFGSASLVRSTASTPSHRTCSREPTAPRCS
jgi:hypothetical protein